LRQRVVGIEEAVTIAQESVTMYPEWQIGTIADLICGEQAFGPVRPAHPAVTDHGRALRWAVDAVQVTIGTALVRAGEWLRRPRSEETSNMAETLLGS
jgi:hypothetical protein